MTENDFGQPRRLLTPGEIKFNERVVEAQQLVKQMELLVRPNATKEELERFIKPRNNRDGEIGWSWYYTTTTEGRDATGFVDLELKNHRNNDFISTGVITLAIARVAYMPDDRSQSIGGGYWAQTIGDEQASDIYREAQEKLAMAWEEVKDLATRLPETARAREVRKHEYFH